MEIKPLKVQEVTQYIKRILTSDPLLYNIKVEGEISNFKFHYSGHMYFTLKDEKAKIKCVMFNSNCSKLKFIPEDGMNVIITGSISIYERDGNYQLYVKEIEPQGLGELYIAYEQLKKKLEFEGLFNQEHKKSLPFLPNKIGVITSATGAAVRDIITVVKRRLPCVDIVIFPVLVQGDKAKDEICRAIEYFDRRKDIDVIIIGRGGGSIEELWAFNEENVARTIFNINTPLISAVGHETDFTISDFVADLRAPTPSAAGELVVPSLEELNNKLEEIVFKLFNSYKKLIEKHKSQLELVKTKIIYNNPSEIINQQKQLLDNLLVNLIRNFMNISEKSKNSLQQLGGKLHALSPLSVLERGYSLVLNNSGHVVKSISDIKIGEYLELILKDGTVIVESKKISK